MFMYRILRIALVSVCAQKLDFYYFSNFSYLFFNYYTNLGSFSLQC
jgi:hypothetical protein